MSRVQWKKIDNDSRKKSKFISKFMKEKIIPNLKIVFKLTFTTNLQN